MSLSAYQLNSRNYSKETGHFVTKCPPSQTFKSPTVDFRRPSVDPQFHRPSDAVCIISVKKAKLTKCEQFLSQISLTGLPASSEAAPVHCLVDNSAILFYLSLSLSLSLVVADNLILVTFSDMLSSFLSNVGREPGDLLKYMIHPKKKKKRGRIVVCASRSGHDPAP